MHSFFRFTWHFWHRPTNTSWYIGLLQIIWYQYGSFNWIGPYLAVVWNFFFLVWRCSNSRSPAVGGSDQPLPADERRPAEMEVVVAQRRLVRYGVILHFFPSDYSASMYPLEQAGGQTNQSQWAVSVFACIRSDLIWFDLRLINTDIWTKRKKMAHFTCFVKKDHKE